MESVGVIQEAASAIKGHPGDGLVRPVPSRPLYCCSPLPSLTSHANPIESSSSRVDHHAAVGGGSNLGVSQFVTAARGIGMEWGGMQQIKQDEDDHPEVEGEVVKKKAAHACSQCGKEFASAKALFGHMSCHASSIRFCLGLAASEVDQDHEIPQAAAAAADSSDNDSIEAAYVGVQAKKRKTISSKQQQKMMRSNRAHHRRPANRIKDEKDYVADCLVMLSSSAASPPRKRTPSCASAANSSEEEEVEWRSPSLQPRRVSTNSKGGGAAAAAAAKYSCSTCKRVFKSHQALGGHRASHKKVKGCFARTSSSSSSKATTTLTTLAGSGSGEGEFEGEAHEEEEDEEEAAAQAEQEGDRDRDHDHDDQEEEPQQLPPAAATARAPLHHQHHAAHHPNPNNSNSNRSAVVATGHECSVCHRVFATGQALGGHKRCHWVASSADNSPPGLLPNTTTTNNNNHNLSKQAERKQLLNLDLNLPPPADDRDNNLNHQETSASCDTTSNSSIHQQFKASWNHSPAAYYNSSISSSRII